MNNDEDDEEQLVVRPLTASNDRLEVVCRWGGLLVALGLLVYAGFFISQ